jgi:hypothetical protein
MCGIENKNYSTHSFRRGFVIFCLQNGVPEGTIKQIGDWNGNQMFPCEMSRTATGPMLIKRRMDEIWDRNQKDD